MIAGYNRYRIHLRRNLFERMPDWARRLYRANVYPNLPGEIRKRKFAYNVALPWRDRYVDGISFLPSFEREMPLLSSDFRALSRGDCAPEKVMYKYFEQAPAKDPIGQMLYVDAKTYMVADILTKVDRMSMATSLEVRVPILDHIFAEWVTALPSEWKLRRGKQKYILRRLAERIGVPREVLYRRKQGFAVPMVRWMKHELKELIMTVLLDSRTLQRGYFEPRGVHQILEEHFHGHRDQSGRIWRLLMFELWHRNYLEKVRSTDKKGEPYYVTPTAETPR
jgi:asparagine synthase (glutamine-hydrolysing)